MLWRVRLVCDICYRRIYSRVMEVMSYTTRAMVLRLVEACGRVLVRCGRGKHGRGFRPCGEELLVLQG